MSKLTLRKLRRSIRQLPVRDLTVFGVGILVALFGIRLSTAETPPAPINPLLTPETQTINSPWVPDSVKRWHATIEVMSQRYNIDPTLIAIIMTMESGGYSKANSGQAVGLMQITPLTAKDIARKYLKQPIVEYQMFDPKTNIEFGAAYLAHLRDIYGDADKADPNKNISSAYTVELIAAAYNGGYSAAQAIKSGEGLNDPQSLNYSRDVFNMWRERRAPVSPTYKRWFDRGGSSLVSQARAENIKI